MEYFPFGETFAHEHSNTQRTPYRFTGKEYDEVTGLYYYGARYYDPRTSVWQSPDPILGKYMFGETNSGVFNPRNLSLYTYSYNNPVNLVDPDGDSPMSVIAKQVAKIGVKDAIKNYGEKTLIRRFKSHMSSSDLKQFKKEVNKIADTLDQEWWEVGIELIPVAGDIYGATKFTKDAKKAWGRLQMLENRWAKKINDRMTLEGDVSGLKKLKKGLRRAGVRDARKDADEMGIKHKGLDGHHKKYVSRKEGVPHRSDPSNIEFQTPAKHKQTHAND